MKKFAVTVAVLALGLAACEGRNEENAAENEVAVENDTANDVDAGMNDAAAAADNALDAASNAVDNAGEAIDNAAESVADTADNAQ